jgi:outer membrane protein TolC
MRATRLALCLFVLALAPLAASAQARPTMTFAQYLDRVMQRNLDLAAAQRDVSAAEARVQIGARLPDPVISGGLVSFDASHPTRSEQRTDTVPGTSQPVCGYATGPSGSPSRPCLLQLPTIVGLGIDVPIELGDQQGGRMDVARVGVRSASETVDDDVRVLRGQAATAWIDALATRLDRDRLQQTLASLERLVETNQARVNAGAIGQLELVQSRVEAQMFRAQVHTADGSAQAALLGLAALSGGDDEIAPSYEPVGDLTLDARTFTLAQLLAQAMENRPDLRVAQLQIESARAARTLAERQRWGNVDVMFNWLYSAPGTDTQFGQTDYHAISLMVAVPLPFRLLWHGEIDEASAMEQAADARYQQALRRLEVELRQALARYEAAVQARALFDQSVVSDAEQVLASTRYQYERGGTSLLAVLVAQRTVNDVYGAYLDALAAHAHALVDLETAAGIWDVDFGTSTPSIVPPTPTPPPPADVPAAPPSERPPTP